MCERILSEEYCNGFQKPQLRDRIDMLASRLAELGYSGNTIDEHAHEWRRFSRYCSDTGMEVPSSIYAPEIEEYLRQRKLRHGRSRIKFIAASLRIFIEADDSGIFSRRRRDPPKPTTTLFKEWVPPYALFIGEHRGVRDLRKNVLVLREFMKFLEKAGIQDFRSLRANHIHDFCMSRGNRTAVTWPSYISIVRRFLHYVFMREGMEQDLSSALGGAKRYRHTGLHDVLTEPELIKLLACIDRSHALGRRDYAMILIGARYGMRPCDIRNLRLDDIHWRDNHITFRQSKTGKHLSLPLLPEVAEALIDYLYAGRPPTRVRNIFIRHRAPFEPFAPADNLATVMIRALKRAELDQRPGSRGFYLLRHTLATRMLGVNVPLKMIGDILGHTSTESTLGYTKVDLPALRTASLSIAEVLQ